METKLLSLFLTIKMEALFLSNLMFMVAVYEALLGLIKPNTCDLTA